MLCSPTTLLALIASTSVLIKDVQALPTRRSIGVKRLPSARLARRAPHHTVATANVDDVAKTKVTKVVYNPKSQGHHIAVEAQLPATRFAKLVRSLVGADSAIVARTAAPVLATRSFEKAFQPRIKPGSRERKRRGELLDAQNAYDAAVEALDQSDGMTQVSTENGPAVVNVFASPVVKIGAVLSGATASKTTTTTIAENSSPTSMPETSAAATSAASADELEPITMTVTFIPNPQGPGYVDAAAFASTASTSEAVVPTPIAAVEDGDLTEASVPAPTLSATRIRRVAVKPRRSHIPVDHA